MARSNAARAGYRRARTASAFTRAARLATLATLALAALAPPPATAGAEVYWSTVPAGITLGKIGRAPLDGKPSFADVRFTDVPGAGPGWLAVGGRQLYWTHMVGGYPGIGRGGLDFSGLNDDVGQVGHARQIAVGRTHVYWTGVASNSISRATLDGYKITRDIIPVDAGPALGGIALDTRHIYWVRSGYRRVIGRADLDGGHPDFNFIKTGIEATALAVDARHVYWFAPRAGAIFRADIDGGDVDGGWHISAKVFDIAVGDDYIYWTGSGCCIGRAKLDGSNVDERWLYAGGEPWGIAVDRAPDTRINSATKKLLGARQPAGPRQRVPREWRLKFRFLSSQPDSIFRCSFDGSAYRPCTSPKLYGRVAAGAHSFKVKARSPQRLTDRSPARKRFTLDLGD